MISLVDLFGKATKKILKLDDTLNEYKSIEGYEVDAEEQEIGFTRTHTKYFKAIRLVLIKYHKDILLVLFIVLDAIDWSISLPKQIN